MAATATSTARGTRAGQTLGEEVEAARDAGLRYVTDDRPGITRRRAGKGFSYRNAHGERITDKSQLTRIRAIAVPPAWTSVWICPNPRGHIQATGRDVRGRKQYRYHPDWRSLRDASNSTACCRSGAHCRFCGSAWSQTWPFPAPHASASWPPWCG